MQARPLSPQEYARYHLYFDSAVLTHARIVEGNVPFWLLPNMIAVVLGTTIYFRPNLYLADSIESVRLLAHELTHVEQWLAGMRIWKYLWASRYGYARNAYEREAIAKSNHIMQSMATYHPHTQAIMSRAIIAL